MDILIEIREYFASIQNGARVIKALPEEFPAIAIRNPEGYGVAIVFDDEKDILEKFANSSLQTQVLSIDGIEKKYLVLKSTKYSLRYEFAAVCAQFVDPGINGVEREKLLTDPLEWWKQWRELMGNVISDKTPYSVIAEMVVFESLYEKDSVIEWAAENPGSHDIESSERSYEVKSTIKRYGATVTISSQYQLESTKPLQLHFVRLEKSLAGVSINDMTDRLVLKGYDKEKLEQRLHCMGYEYGISAREERYKILEKRIYEVDENFPKIVKCSFKDNHIPKSVVQITYVIDLDALEYISE